MLAIIAPGQGAQTPRMLTHWLENLAAKELLASFSDAIRLDLEHLGTSADADEIKETANAQPLIVATGLLAAHALGANGKFFFTAGHSVGEITAAVIAGVLTPLDAMQLVRFRGIEMAKAAALKPSGMSAILGGERTVVLKSISDAHLVAANENGGGQIVAAGDLVALGALAPVGARVRALAVAGAFHTEYMQSAVAPLREYATTLKVSNSSIGFISNKDGKVIRDGGQILNLIVNQIANPVRWDLCMATLKNLGVTGVIELPPAGTLVGLLKRAEPIIETFALKSPADLELAQEFVQRHQENN